jgi:hypothetical protein
VAVISNIVVFQWIKNPRSTRLATAQALLEESICSYGLTPLRYPAGGDLIPIGNVLTEARRQTKGSAFVWCNSDVVLTKNPFVVPNPQQVYGFYRKEVPSGEICGGVDMYYIPVKWWDECLTKDVPKLYLGASYVDRWISRAMQKVGAYENLVGYIDHVTHAQSEAAGSDANPYYQKNFRAYNAWAKRNGLESIPASPYLLPGIGHVWGLRDALRKILAAIRLRASRLRRDEIRDEAQKPSKRQEGSSD